MLYIYIYSEEELQDAQGFARKSFLKCSIVSLGLVTEKRKDI